MPLAVIRLPLVVDDEVVRHRIEDLYAAMWQVKQTLQRDARAVVDAYWAGDRRRETDARAWRAELGLSRTGLERRAYTHLERSVWLADHVSKALVMHQADEVWNGVARHLTPDAAGRRAGRPRTGSWWEYTRIPGRARSHTKDRKWETFRLHGTLAGHLDAYRHPALPARVTGPARATALDAGVSVLAQPHRLPTPARPAERIPTGTYDARGRERTRAASWFDHTGPLVVVFAGGPASARGELVLPVRLPQGAGRWPRLAHFLIRPELWHKIDLVRNRDVSAPGGWRYEAHLSVLADEYVSPATTIRRTQAAALDRVGGVDGNVSNLAVVSLPATGDRVHGEILSSRITLTGDEQATLARQSKQTRDRNKALDRSRRASNPVHYRPSRPQQQRDERRAAKGLKPRRTTVPAGARTLNAAGKPRQAHRRDELSNTYLRLRGRQTMAAACAAEASQHRARRLAAGLVAAHGARLTIEDCDIRSWFRRWGRACQATTPGRLIAALAAECAAVNGGRLLRASTFATALSQHCLCGRRAPKPLNQRTHHCDPDEGGCGLRGDRDLVAAALAAYTTLTDPDAPSTARLDILQARNAQIVFHQGLQEALTESTVNVSPPHSRGRSTTAAHPAPAHTQHRVPVPGPQTAASARRTAGTWITATPDETRTALLRPKAHAGTTRPHPGPSRTPLRDSS